MKTETIDQNRLIYGWKHDMLDILASAGNSQLGLEEFLSKMSSSDIEAGKIEQRGSEQVLNLFSFNPFLSTRIAQGTDRKTYLFTFGLEDNGNLPFLSKLTEQLRLDTTGFRYSAEDAETALRKRIRKVIQAYNENEAIARECQIDIRRAFACEIYRQFLLSYRGVNAEEAGILAADKFPILS